MKKIISIFLLIVLTTNIGFAQIVDNISNNDNNNVVINLENENNQNNINNEEIQKLIDTYQDDINKIIKKEKKQMTSDIFYERMEDFGYSTNHRDVIREERWGRIKLLLNDGDYVVWHSKALDTDYGKSKKATQYAAEYHKDGNLMGIVKMRKINKKISAFYEYRLREPRYSSRDKNIAFLKHIMIHFNEEVPVTFVVTEDGNVRGVLYKEQLFSKDLENIVNIGKLDMSSLNNPNVVLNTVGVLGGTVVGALYVGGVIAGVPLQLVFWPSFLVFMVIAGNIEENNKKRKEVKSK